MNKETVTLLCKQFNIDRKVLDFVNAKEKIVEDKFKKVDEIKEYNQYKVINSMQQARLSSTDFNWTTGYG